MKLPKIKFSTNVIVQVLGVLLQVLNQYGSVVPAKYQFYVAFAIAVVQALVAFLGHFSTPTGNTLPKG